jgi:hypothetical protein
LSSRYACAVVAGRRMKNAALNVAASTSTNTKRGERMNAEPCGAWMEQRVRDARSR